MVCKLLDAEAMKSSNPTYKWWLLIIMMMSTAMTILDTTIVNSIIPVLLKDFGTTLSKVEWIVTGYLLSMCVTLPTAGWLAEKWGYKRIYILAMVFFTLGSFMCYLSPGINELIGARIFQGFGSGAVQSLGLAIIIRNFDTKTRTIALGLWGIASAAAVSMGPYMGGEMLRAFGWNSLFAVNVPIGVLNIIAVAIIYQEYKDPKAGRFNLGGFLLTALWAPLLVVGLAMGVSQGGGALAGWDSPFVILSLLGAVAMLVGFVIYNKRSASPIIDFSIFKDRNFRLSLIALGCLGFGFYGGNYLLPLYMEHSLSYSAIVVGSLYLPVGIIQGVLAPLSGFIARRTGEWILVVIGFSFFVVYLIISAVYGQSTPMWVIVLSVVLRGVALGLAFTPLNALSVKNLDKEQMTSASELNNTVKQVSGSIGIALFTALLAISMHPSKITAQTPAKLYIDGIDLNFVIAAGLAVVALVCLLMIKKKSRNFVLLKKKVAIKDEKR